MNNYKFEKIKVKGYRRLFNTEIQMRPLTVMIGPNGAGKTSVLEVFSLLASSARGKLRETVSNSGGIQDILTSGKSDDISFSLSMSVPDHNPLFYDIFIPVPLQGTTTSLTADNF